MNLHEIHLWIGRLLFTEKPIINPAYEPFSILAAASLSPRACLSICGRTCVGEGETDGLRHSSRDSPRQDLRSHLRQSGGRNREMSFTCSCLIIAFTS